MRQLFIFILILLAVGTKAQRTLDNTFNNKCVSITDQGRDTLSGSFTLFLNFSTFPDLGTVRLLLEYKGDRKSEEVVFNYCSADPLSQNETLHRECEGYRVITVNWELRTFKLIDRNETKLFYFED